MRRNMDLHAVGFWRSEREPHLPDPNDHVDPHWNPTERTAALQYLQTQATGQLSMRGYSPCRICGQRNGSREYSNNLMRWPQGLAHYIQDHNVRLPEETIALMTEPVGDEPADWMLDPPDTKRLLSEIEERRKDPEFKARLDRIMTEEKHILDRLAKDD